MLRAYSMYRRNQRPHWKLDGEGLYGMSFSNQYSVGGEVSRKVYIPKALLIVLPILLLVAVVLLFVAVNGFFLVKTPATAPPPDPEILVGAGDIAGCSSEGDEATADLLDGIAGTVFTVGDNAYESGTDAEFEECYQPSWGRHKARTYPSPG